MLNTTGGSQSSHHTPEKSWLHWKVMTANVSRATSCIIRRVGDKEVTWTTKEAPATSDELWGRMQPSQVVPLLAASEEDRVLGLKRLSGLQISSFGVCSGALNTEPQQSFLFQTKTNFIWTTWTGPRSIGKESNLPCNLGQACLWWWPRHGVGCRWWPWRARSTDRARGVASLYVQCYNYI